MSSSAATTATGSSFPQHLPITATNTQLSHADVSNVHIAFELRKVCALLRCACAGPTLFTCCRCGRQGRAEHHGRRDADVHHLADRQGHAAPLGDEGACVNGWSERERVCVCERERVSE